jgi:hypothetical protein
MSEHTLPGMLAAFQQQKHILERVTTDLEELMRLQSVTQWAGTISNGHAPKVRKTRGRGKQKPAHPDPAVEAKRKYQREWRANRMKKKEEQPELPLTAATGRKKSKAKEAKGRDKTTIAYVLEAIEAAKQPLSVAAIVERIQAAGWTTAGTAKDVVGQALYALVHKEKKLRKWQHGNSAAVWGFPKWNTAAQAALRLMEAAAAP